MQEDSVAHTRVDTPETAEPGEDLARLAAEAAWEKKALGLRVLDVRGLVTYTDYLLICSGTSDRQVRAIAESIDQALSERGTQVLGVEGREGGKWVLMDFGDLVVHAFTEAERDVYGLDRLWGDAPMLSLQAPPDLERPAYY